MTAYTIDKIHAVQSSSPKLTHVPHSLNASALVEVLRGLNLMVPTSLAAAASGGGDPLHASGHAYTVSEVDAALSRSNLTLGDRFKIKTAMSRNGILRP